MPVTPVSSTAGRLGLAGYSGLTREAYELTCAVPGWIRYLPVPRR
jgi:hypothetical protein